jgi:hypothetical protein
MLMFCVGIQPLYEELQALLVDKHSQMRNLPAGSAARPADIRPFAFAFADDGNFRADVRVLAASSSGVVDCYKRYGLDCNIVKSVGFCREELPADIYELLGVEKKFEFNTRGAHVLGVPVGTRAYVQGELAAHMPTLTRELPTLVTELHPQVAFYLLKHCVNQRPQYVSRTIELHQRFFFEQLQAFDGEVNRALGDLVTMPREHAPSLSVHGRFLDGVILRTSEERRILELVRGLPVSEGGLGMPVHSAIAGVYQRDSRERTAAFMSAHNLRALLDSAQRTCWAGEALIDEVYGAVVQRQPEVAAADRLPMGGVGQGGRRARPRRPSAADYFQEAPPPPHAEDEVADAVPEKARAKVIVSREQTQFATYIMGLLPTDLHRANFLSQRCIGTGRIFTWHGGGHVYDWRMLPFAFRTAVRARCGIFPVTEQAAAELRGCGCFAAAAAADAVGDCLIHAQVCALNAGLRTERSME